MVSKEVVATRSSPRLKNKVRQTFDSHKNSLDDNNKGDHSPVQDETSTPSSSTASNIAYVPQSLLAEEKPDRELAVHPALIRKTTNRRGGGRVAGPLSKQSCRVNLKQRNSDNKEKQSDSDSHKELEHKMKDVDNHAGISVHTPSTAAAAAAAAAKALFDHSHSARGRYDLGTSRSFLEERQNVFRARGDDYHSRITTKTRSDGAIRKPGMPFGNSTIRVMGSPTPTHISTRPYGPGINMQRSLVTDNRYKSPSKSQAVFRKPHPCADASRQFDSVDALPHQLLVSLKSGSRSFELKSPGGNYAAPHRNHGPSDDTTNRSSQSNVPQSPEAPPDIHHSHHQVVRTELFSFHPRTPKTPKTPNIDFARSENLHGTPSFSLFNQSFDSLVDASYLRSPNDQPLAVNFSLMDASPQKKSFMASPGSNFQGFSFSPTKQHTEDLEDFVEGSPGISLDNCMVDAMDDAPLLPRTRKASDDALGGSDVVVLESSKLVRDVPTPTVSNQSPRIKSKDVPLKKRHNLVPLEHRSDNVVQNPSSDRFDTDKRVMEGPSVVRLGANIQEHYHPVNKSSHHEHIKRTPVPPQQAYGQAILPPPHIYRSGFHPNFYQNKGKDTTLVGLNLDQIHERFASHQEAFRKCCYLLPGFQTILGESKIGQGAEESKSVSNEVVKAVSPDRNDGDKAEIEIKDKENHVVASRRVDSAICAFGGQVIKREKSVDFKTYYSNAVTNRYFEHESRISWDVEESPPIETPRKSSNKTQTESPIKRVGDDIDMNPKTPKASKTNEWRENSESASRTADEEGPDGVRGDAPRMKYRCKLCGKPKQNHKCPYQKSLQRSIGVSVYPAVNAFAASEPGNLAPALSDMNNFVREESLPEITPARPKRLENSIFRGQHPMAYRSAPHVTPESMRSIKSPSPYVYQESYNSSSHVVISPMRNIRKRHILSPEKNSTRSQLCHLSDLVFLESTPLREEQFRTSSSKNLGNFEYPCIPLPYSQRKTLSDNLFELSKEVPTLKEECAIVLRQAREDDMWDVAVAELLTQVIVAIHCPPEDRRLEGLSRFLNSLGFAC